MTQIKSCFTCKHIKTWSYSATLEEPSDEGWECNHPIFRNAPTVELKPDPNCNTCHGTGWLNCGSEGTPQCWCWSEDDDQALAKQQAANCPGYEFYDWKKFSNWEIESEAW